MLVCSVKRGNRKSISPEFAVLVVVARRSAGSAVLAGSEIDNASGIAQTRANSRCSILESSFFLLTAVAQFNNPWRVASNSDWADFAKRVESAAQVK